MGLRGYSGPSFSEGAARQAASPIHKLLEEGERILWEGQPDPAAHFVEYDIFLVPFGVLWGGFMIACVGMVLYSIFQHPDAAGGWLFLIAGIPLMGIPTIIMGLYFIYGRFWVKSDSKAKTYYAITDKRAIIYSSYFGERIREARV